MIFAGCHIFDGKRQCRFFGESFNRKYRKAFCGNRLAHAFDVAEAGFRASWRNTKNHQEPARKSNVQRSGNDLSIFFRLRDVMICGEHRE